MRDRTRRTSIAIAAVVFVSTVSALVADERPGMIVVRPQGPTGGPDRSGFLVIRPQVPGQPTETVLQEQPGVPTPPVGTATPEQPPASGGVPQEPTATPEDGKIVLETWDAAYVRGQKIGHFHVVVREYERDGEKFIYATKTQRLTIARFGELVHLWAEDATMERPDGTILTTRMRQGIGRDQKLSLAGTVKDGKLHVAIEGDGTPGGVQEVPWPDGVLGIAKEATLLADRKPKPGDTLDYLFYEGRLNRVVKILVNAKKSDTVVLVEGQKPRPVVVVEQGMEPIGNFRLPPSTMYCDPETFEPLKAETEMPMLGGRLAVIRTTRSIALQPVTNVPDLFNVQSIRLDRTVPGIHDLGAVVYRMTGSGEVSAAKLLPSTDRQAVKPTDESGQTVELTVTAAPVARADANAPADPGREFTLPSFFIDWDNDRVKQLAASATTGLAADADPLEKARAIESWVNRNMRAVEFSQAMASCSNVARTLSGDCTEYAMLSVGMCRAAGVPARTALGLVYAPVGDGKPYLAYHMWFEAYAGGRWVPFDATLGRGGVGPGHIKITDTSWHEERSFAPLLPVLTVLGAAPKFEVVRAANRTP